MAPACTHLSPQPREELGWSQLADMERPGMMAELGLLAEELAAYYGLGEAP